MSRYQRSLCKEETLAVLLEGAEGGKDERGGGEVPQAVGEHCCVEGLGSRRGGGRGGGEGQEVVQGWLLDPTNSTA